MSDPMTDELPQAAHKFAENLAAALRAVDDPGRELSYAHAIIPKQSRIDSVIEVVVNIAIGASISLLSQLVIFPAYGIYVSAGTHIWIVAWFTVVSIARQYAIRRLCNGRSPWMYLRSRWS